MGEISSDDILPLPPPKTRKPKSKLPKPKQKSRDSKVNKITSKKKRNLNDDFKLASSNTPKRKKRDSNDDYKLAAGTLPKLGSQDSLVFYEISNIDSSKKKSRKSEANYQLAPASLPKHKKHDAQNKVSSQKPKTKQRISSKYYETRSSQQKKRHSDDYHLAPTNQSVPDKKSHFSDDDFELVPTFPKKPKRLSRGKSPHRKSKRKQSGDSDKFFLAETGNNKHQSTSRKTEEFHTPAFNPAKRNAHFSDNNAEIRTLYRDKSLSRNHPSDFVLAPSTRQSTENTRNFECEEFLAAPMQYNRLRKDAPYPSCGVTVTTSPSFTPKHDISGRFFIPQFSSRRRYTTVQRYEKVKSCIDLSSTSKDLSQAQLTPGPACIHLPQANCGLHCIQSNQNRRTSSAYREAPCTSKTANPSSKNDNQSAATAISGPNRKEGSSSSTE